MERQLIATSNEVLGPNSRTALLAQSDLAWILAMAARFPEAEIAAREAYERQQKVFGIEDPDTLESARRLAVSLEK